MCNRYVPYNKLNMLSHTDCIVENKIVDLLPTEREIHRGIKAFPPSCLVSTHPRKHIPYDEPDFPFVEKVNAVS